LSFILNNNHLEKIQSKSPDFWGWGLISAYVIKSGEGLAGGQNVVI
jgi:hypothetical protein